MFSTNESYGRRKHEISASLKPCSYGTIRLVELSRIGSCEQGLTTLCCRVNDSTMTLMHHILISSERSSDRIRIESQRIFIFLASYAAELTLGVTRSPGVTGSMSHNPSPNPSVVPITLAPPPVS